MKSVITELARDVYRISTFHPDFGLQFNQFLVVDDEPLLVHTAFKKMFPVTVEGVASVIDPSRVRWIGFSHFEPDECGALNHWLARAPRAEAVCGFVGALVMLNDFADRPPRVLKDGEVIDTGHHRVRYLSTPHVPHCWDAGLLFLESDRTLFCSDLFFHPGDPEPVTKADVVGRARDSIVKSAGGPMANDIPYTPYTDATLRRLAALKPTRLALMHGSTFEGDGESALLGLAGVLAETLGARG